MSSFNLPQRAGDPPVTGKQPPQLQFSDQSPRNIYRKMAEWFFSTFPHTREEPTRISVPTSRALWLNEDIEASPDAFMPPPGSREFAHLHEDGSFHLVMDEKDEQEVIAKGWGLYHPWRDRGHQRNSDLRSARRQGGCGPQASDRGILSLRHAKRLKSGS